jgi:hypothetical protein
MDVYFRRLQILSAAAFSYSHGTNDARKTMGIITGVLLTTGYLQKFCVPLWVILSAHAAIAMGTLCGGWRIVHTVGSRITRLKPRGGYCAETAAGGGGGSFHDARHRRCPLHPARESRALGSSGQHCLGLVPHYPRRRYDCLDPLHGAAAFGLDQV